MPSRPGRGAFRFVQTARHPVGWLARVLVDNEVRGREHVPEHGPYIVAANHLSLIDPVFVTLAVGRMIRFLALDELYGVTGTLDRMINYFGSIPIARERPPLGALRDALEVLRSGQVDQERCSLVGACHRGPAPALCDNRYRSHLEPR